MNDINDIHLTLHISKDEISNHSFIEENKDNKTFDENKLKELIIHIKENLSKKYYKSIYKQLEILSNNKGLYALNCSWIIFLLKIKILLKIVDRKITKYLIRQLGKQDRNKHINSIKKYLDQIKEEIFIFSEQYDIKHFINNAKIIDKLLNIYFYYIYLVSLYNLKIGSIIDSITFLSLGLRLFKETKLIKKSFSTNNKIEKCFILIIHILIANEDYVSSFEYLKLSMKTCLYDLIYIIDDISDGVPTDFHTFKNNNQLVQNTKNENTKSPFNKNEKSIIFHIMKQLEKFIFQ